jgi:hypothetical protein
MPILSKKKSGLEKKLTIPEFLQSVIPTPIPVALCGVPGYASPGGAGYHALVDGVKVFVPPEVGMAPSASLTPLCSGSTEVPAAEQSLTKAGPPVKGWSWKVAARKAATTRLSSDSFAQRATLLANRTSTSTASLANSFAALAVDPPAEP